MGQLVEEDGEGGDHTYAVPGQVGGPYGQAVSEVMGAVCRQVEVASHLDVRGGGGWGSWEVVGGVGVKPSSTFSTTFDPKLYITGLIHPLNVGFILVWVTYMYSR